MNSCRLDVYMRQIMDDMMKIHLLIDNERYPMTIRREDEQLYRDAAKQIDNKLNKYRKMCIRDSFMIPLQLFAVYRTMPQTNFWKL